MQQDQLVNTNYYLEVDLPTFDGRSNEVETIVFPKKSIKNKRVSLFYIFIIIISCSHDSYVIFFS